MSSVAPANAESREAWDGVLFDRFVTFRRQIIDGLTAHGEVAIQRHPPAAGARALDIGCGFGDTARRLAELVGPSGSVLGVDVAPRFIAAARDESAGMANVRFEVADIQATPFGETFDYAFSRFGTMFFASPVAALRNVAAALAPGGTLCSVVWRRKIDNPWMHRAETVVKPLVVEDPDSEEPTCGPGPFSMANADTVADILVLAGFTDIAFERCDIPYVLGADLDEAIAFNTALGPAAEAIRLAGDQADEVRPQIEAVLRDALAEFVTPEGVVAMSSTWVVTATASGSTP